MFFKNKKVDEIIQEQAYECGIASLAMCMNYHGRNVELEEIREKYEIPNDGSTFHDLSDISEEEGFITDSYKAEIDELNQLKLPAIIHWELNHFIVLKKIKNGKYLVSDPSIGSISYSKSEFSKGFSGYCLEVTPSKINKNKKDKKNKLTLKFFLENSSGFYNSLFFIFFTTFLIQLITIFIPIYTQILIDDYIILNNSENLVYFFLCGLGLVAFRFYTDLIKNWSIIFVGYRWHSHFSSYFLKKILRLEIKYFEARGSSDIFSRFNGIFKLKEALTEKIIEGFIDSLMIFSTLTIMFIYNIKLTLISLFFFLSYVIFRFFIFKKEEDINKKEILSKVKEDSFFLETIRSMESVKIYGVEKNRYEKWKKLYIKSTNYSVKISKYRMWNTSIQELLEGSELLILLSLAALLVLDEKISLGMFFAFFAFKNIFSKQGKSFINNIAEINLLKIHLRRLEDIHNQKNEENYYPLINKQEFKGDIKLENISFKYDGKDEYIFKDFSLHIKSGENVVITGESGKGKSTLLKIIMGILPINSGRILIDDIDLNLIGLKKYRDNISAVTQNSDLISTSIIENIAFHKYPINKDKIIESAEKACIKTYIENLNMKYNTIIGEVGGILSGGQKQRILLARAFYKNSSILFLDEATSSLNIEIEKEIVNNIKEMGITRISISHRKESVLMADRVIKI